MQDTALGLIQSSLDYDMLSPLLPFRAPSQVPTAQRDIHRGVSQAFTVIFPDAHNIPDSFASRVSLACVSAQKTGWQFQANRTILSIENEK